MSIFTGTSSSSSKSSKGTILFGSEATLSINSFNTDLGTFSPLFTFGVVTSFAILKKSLKKQCCYCFLWHIFFLESSANLQTSLLLFNSSMRQTNAAYSFSSEQLFMVFAQSFILLRTSFICFKRLNGFLIFISSFICQTD